MPLEHELEQRTLKLHPDAGHLCLLNSLSLTSLRSRHKNLLDLLQYEQNPIQIPLLQKFRTSSSPLSDL